MKIQPLTKLEQYKKAHQDHLQITRILKALKKLRGSDSVPEGGRDVVEMTATSWLVNANAQLTAAEKKINQSQM